MPKTINLCRPTSAPPPTEYGLIYTPNDPNLAPKVAFYRINPDDSSKLQYTLDWGQSYVDNSTYIEWTVDDITNTINSQDQLESIIARTISPRAGSILDGKAIIVPYEQFISGSLLIGGQFWYTWELSGSHARFDTYCPSVGGITVRGGCDIEQVYRISTTTQIDVTKYVG